MDNLDAWLSEKLADIAEKLPTIVHSDPVSFACGYNSGYKHALLDLDRYLEGMKNITE